MTEIDVSDVITGEYLAGQVRDGDVTHFETPEQRGTVGDTFKVQGEQYVLTSVVEQPLDSFDLPEEARKQLASNADTDDPTLFRHNFSKQTE